MSTVMLAKISAICRYTQYSTDVDYCNACLVMLPFFSVYIQANSISLFLIGMDSVKLNEVKLLNLADLMLGSSSVVRRGICPKSIGMGLWLGLG